MPVLSPSDPRSYVRSAPVPGEDHRGRRVAARALGGPPPPHPGTLYTGDTRTRTEVRATQGVGGSGDTVPTHVKVASMFLPHPKNISCFRVFMCY